MISVVIIIMSWVGMGVGGQSILTIQVCCSTHLCVCVWRGDCACTLVRVCVCVRAGDCECKGIVFQCVFDCECKGIVFQCVSVSLYFV